MDFVGGKSLGSYTLSGSNSLYRPLCEFSRYLLEQVFPTPVHSLFHIESFVGKDDQIMLCEIACRLGGNDLVAEVELAYGVNIVEAYLQAEFKSHRLCGDALYPKQVGGRFQLPPQSGQLICISHRNRLIMKGSSVLNPKLHLETPTMQ